MSPMLFLAVRRRLRVGQKDKPERGVGHVIGYVPSATSTSSLARACVASNDESRVRRANDNDRRTNKQTYTSLYVHHHPCGSFYHEQ